MPGSAFRPAAFAPAAYIRPPAFRSLLGAPHPPSRIARAMETFEYIVSRLEYFVWSWPEIGGELSLIVIALLGVGVFLRRQSVLRYSEARLRRTGEAIARFAEAEELDAHALAVRVRLNALAEADAASVETPASA